MIQKTYLPLHFILLHSLDVYYRIVESFSLEKAFKITGCKGGMGYSDGYVGRRGGLCICVTAVTSAESEHSQNPASVCVRTSCMESPRPWRRPCWQHCVSSVPYGQQHREIEVNKSRVKFYALCFASLAPSLNNTDHDSELIKMVLTALYDSFVQCVCTLAMM